jgi:hypothetical protein
LHCKSEYVEYMERSQRYNECKWMTHITELFLFTFCVSFTKLPTSTLTVLLISIQKKQLHLLQKVFFFVLTILKRKFGYIPFAGKVSTLSLAP